MSNQATNTDHFFFVEEREREIDDRMGEKERQQIIQIIIDQ
jgi:hypothetical protein